MKLPTPGNHVNQGQSRNIFLTLMALMSLITFPQLLIGAYILI